MSIRLANSFEVFRCGAASLDGADATGSGMRGRSSKLSAAQTDHLTGTDQPSPIRTGMTGTGVGRARGSGSGNLSGEASC